MTVCRTVGNARDAGMIRYVMVLEVGVIVSMTGCTVSDTAGCITVAATTDFQPTVTARTRMTVRTGIIMGSAYNS